MILSLSELITYAPNRMDIFWGFGVIAHFLPDAADDDIDAFV